MKLKSIPLIMLFIVLLCAHQAFTADASLKDLASLKEMQDVFQKDAGKVRMIVILSPT